MKAIRLALSAGLLLASIGRAAEVVSSALPDHARPPATEYLVECQMVRVSAKTVVTLVPELSDENTAAGAWEKMQGMMARGEGTLAAYLLGRGAERRTITAG